MVRLAVIGVWTLGSLCHAQKEPRIVRASAFDIGKSPFLIPAVAPGQVLEFGVRLPAAMVEVLKPDFLDSGGPPEPPSWPLKLAWWSATLR